MQIKALAAAKINLGLEVLGKLPSGYHELDMVMQSVNLFDTIFLKKNQGDEIKLSCDKPLNCSLEENTVFLAAKKFFEHTKIKSGLEIKIEKMIPERAGMAGGSTDAAATLRALNELFDTNLNGEELLNLAAEIGSDVPFCLLGGTARAGGTGNALKKLKKIPKCKIILVKPKKFVSTPQAYGLLKEENFCIKKENSRTKSLVSAIKTGNLQEICSNLFNTFEDVLPMDIKFEIQKIKSIFAENLALGSLMTGSGTAVFGIFEDEILARNCFLDFKKTYPETFLCEPGAGNYIALDGEKNSHA